MVLFFCAHVGRRTLIQVDLNAGAVARGFILHATINLAALNIVLMSLMRRSTRKKEKKKKDPCVESDREVLHPLPDLLNSSLSLAWTQ